MDDNANKWVALLRGINVGGNNKVPMADLRALCADLGWTDVQSYIASGNLVFCASGLAPDLAKNLRTAMAAKMGVDVPVLVLSADEIQSALTECPIEPEAGNKLHCVFLWGPPNVDRALFDSLRGPDDVLVEQQRRVWLHTPDGFGASKIATKLDKVLSGDTYTARNLNSLRKLVAMLG